MTVGHVAAGTGLVAGGAVLAAAAGAALSRLAAGPFAASVYGGGLLAVPAFAAVLLAPSPLGRLAGLAVVLAPPLAFACRRVPPGAWRVARALGGSRLLVARCLLLPTVGPPLVAAVLAAAFLLAAREEIR